MKLFKNESENTISENNTKTEVAISDLVPFNKHPFKVIDNEEMELLTQSIKENGIITPLTVRKNDDGKYEVISGHRRLFAATKLGLKTVPVNVLELSQDEATIAMVDSNLQREHILPSEKAFSYQMKYYAMKRKAGRPSRNSCQVGANLRTDEQIAQNSSDSARQIQRYIRLTNLISQILNMMDEGKIALSVGVELSYLTPSFQWTVYQAMQEYDCTPSYAQASQMRKDYEAGVLTTGRIQQMLSKEKPNQVQTVKIPEDRIIKFLKSNATAKDKEDFLNKAVEYYGRHLEKQKNRGAR